MNETKPASPLPTADETADLLMALLGEDGAVAALGDAADGDMAALAAALKAGKQEMRARVKQLAADRPEFLARIITQWLKEERNRGR